MNKFKFAQRVTCNEQINAKEVRIIKGEPLVQSGLYPLQTALEFAKKQDVDLIVVNQQPIPVCRLITIDKFLYEEKQKEKVKQKTATKTTLHELKFSPEISTNDISYRVKHASEWLQKKDKVKCTLQFKGRQIIHKERGELVLLQFADAVKEHGLPEAFPKLEGKRMFMILKPIANKV